MCAIVVIACNAAIRAAVFKTKKQAGVEPACRILGELAFDRAGRPHIHVANTRSVLPLISLATLESVMVGSDSRPSSH